MRQLEPFSYFANHASAIAGFGGAEPPPDPRYFFHTHYEAVPPGRAVYRLTIKGARASRGELTLRVHAFKPGASGDISLAGGGRIVFDEMRPDAATVSLPIRFSAAPDTQYALYGFFSDPTDLVADAIDIAIEELGVRDESGSVPTGLSSAGERAVGFGDINKLCTDRAPSILHPVSQPFTQEQIEPEPFDALWPSIPPFPQDPVTRWTMVVQLQALAGAGMLAPGMRGFVLDAPHPALAETLRAKGCAVTEGLVDAPEAPIDHDAGAEHDFVLGYQSEVQAGATEAYLAFPERLIAQTRTGGLAIAMLVVTPDQPPDMVRNAIQQAALRLIGRGHDVAQLCFPRQFVKAGGRPGQGRFAFVVRV